MTNSVPKTETSSDSNSSATEQEEVERGQFPNTLWTLVCEAQDATEVSAHQALSRLCEMYWYPLYAFVRRSGCSPEDAEDVTQGFFGELLEKNYLHDVSADKGRLRSFLMVAIKHFLHKWRTKARAQKRGGGRQHLSIDQAAAEERYRLEPVEEVTPEVLYDRHWALTLMKHAQEKVRAEYDARGKGELFDALGGGLTGRDTDQPHAEVAAQFGMTEENVRANASRMRKRYKAILQDVISDTVKDEEKVGEEMVHLLSVFGR